MGIQLTLGFQRFQNTSFFVKLKTVGENPLRNLGDIATDDGVDRRGLRPYNWGRSVYGTF